MQAYLASALLLLSSTVALAAGAVDPDRIVAAATGDWNQDGANDLALLVEPAEGGDDENSIYLYLNNEVGKLTLQSIVPDLVSGQFGVYGQAPSIRALPNGSMQIVSRNDAVGRDRWEKILTIAYRDDDFVVAGFTYASRDTLDPNDVTECDLNLLTGKGTANGKPIADGGGTIPLSDWTDQVGFTACGVR